jgi:hypothetical protein
LEEEGTGDDSIKTDVTETECEGVNWTELAQDAVQL